MKRSPFLALVLGLTSAVPAQRALLEALSEEAEACALRGSGFGAEFEPVELPGTGAPRGLAHIGKVVWFARGDRLLRLSWPAATIEVDVAAPAGLSCLAADRRFVYGVASDGIVVIDPIAGRVVRTMQRPEREVSAIGVFGARFVLATPKRAWLCDEKFVEVAELTMLRTPVTWFAANGSKLWGGEEKNLVNLPLPDDTTPAMAWEWPTSLRSGVGTWIEGKLLIAAERAEVDRQGECLSGWFDPLVAEVNSERLVIACYLGSTGSPHFEIGPKPLTSLRAVAKELERIAKDPACIVPRADGTKGVMPVLIRVFPGVRVAEVKAVWDAAIAAGFNRVRAPYLESYVLDRRRKGVGKELPEGK